MEQHSHRRVSVARWLAGVQGSFYLVTGLWPVVHMESFLAVTGPKTDLWLVESFGLLLAAFGLVLVYGAVFRKLSSLLELAALAIAATLAFIDAYYVARGEIARIYLLDALPELLFALGWTLLLARRRAGVLRSRHV